jgi:N-acetylmuramoyl-L-alanine amidase
MRLMFPLWLLWLTSAFTVPAQSSLGKLERVPLFGHEYVRLADWASANKFDLKWIRPDEEVQVKSSWSKLVFTVDSRKAQINGVTVWLSVNVAKRNGGALVSLLDFQTVIHPLLFPPRNTPGEKVKIICLDPGHGGKDPGNQSGRSLEKKLTLLMAEELQKQLKNAGFKVVLTRPEDAFVELMERPFSANRRQADLFVSLHFNAAEGSGARGVETYCLTPAHASSTNARGEGTRSGAYPANKLNDKNVMLAYQVQRALIRNAPTEDRGVRRARFAVLKSPEMPAVLIEGGFMTDPDELKRILNPTHRKKLGQAIVIGIQAYKKIVER